MIITIIVLSILLCITLFCWHKAAICAGELFETVINQNEYIEELNTDHHKNELKYSHIISLENNEKRELRQIIDKFKEHDSICPLLKKERIDERQKKIDALAKEIVAIENEIL